jgi:ABC-type Fe2+-enterobactin transport system substrate-binding protein
MHQEMQYKYNQQMQAMESCFEQRLKQNALDLSKTITSSMGTTLQQHLQQQDQGANSTSSTVTPNLLDFDNPPKPQVHSVQF